MYDPLIVDTFCREYKELTQTETLSEEPGYALNEITHATQAPLHETSRESDEHGTSADGLLTLWELAASLGGPGTLQDTGDLIWTHLRRLIPSSAGVFFLYDSVQDDLEARHVMGGSLQNVRGLRIGLGQRLSGWVAANRQTMLNSDPALDLGELVRTVEPALRSSLSAPLISEEALVGVLTLYSGVSDAFNDRHRRILEVISRQIAQALMKISTTSRRRDDQPKRPPTGHDVPQVH
jgi:GAF domain-containing protein